MINIRDIAMEIQNILGDKYRVYALNNALEFEDIKTGESIDKQLIFQKEKIPVVIQTTPGTVVALSDLFSTSFGFSLDFYVDATLNIDDDLKRLIQALNGQLNDVGDYKFLMTFTTPFPNGGVTLQNGQYNQRIVLTGNCSITDKSVFGNEISVDIIFTDAQYNLNNAIISGAFNMQSNMAPSEGIDGSYIPINTIQTISNGATFSLHFRRDSELLKRLYKIMMNPDLLLDESIKIQTTFDGETTTWDVLITGINTTAVIGGYVIIDVGLTRTQVVV